MSHEDDIQRFDQDHPWPHDDGVTSLFKFSSVNRDKLSRLEQLFCDGKLYHSTPDQFNDPFECKPHFNWPKDPKKVAEIRKHLTQILRRNGISWKEAKRLVANSMRRPGFIHESIYTSAEHSFNRARICSFTTSNKNLLFWAHYANSHKGFCVEYDAKILPISYSFKVKYVDEYPEIEYPAPDDKRALSPALMKSTAWSYEEEYRSIFIPGAERQAKHDGSSLILNGSEMKNIYFGAKMTDDDKALIEDLVSKGPFTAKLWESNLSRTSFEIEFSPYKPGIS